MADLDSNPLLQIIEKAAPLLNELKAQRDTLENYRRTRDDYILRVQETETRISELMEQLSVYGDEFANTHAVLYGAPTVEQE